MIRDRVENIELSIRKISDKARQQDECIRFDIGQPSFDTPEHIKEAAEEGLERKQGYAPTYGLEELRELIAEEESMKKGVNPGKENVLTTVGGAEAIYAVFSTVLENEEVALFNDPCWGPYKLISEVNGNEWSQTKFFDSEGLREEAKRKIKEAKLAVVNTPSNPSGRVLSEDQAREIAEFAGKNGTLLVCDEVYHRLTFDREHVSPYRFTDNAVMIGSVSKNHAMTGWRIGWAVSRKEYIDNFAKASRGMTACPPKISQIAAVEALKDDSHVEEMRETYRERRDLIVKRMEELGWEFNRPEGGIYAFPDVGEDSWDFCMRMIEKGVAMVPGEPFGPESDTNVRICFGSTSKEEIDRAFDILQEEIG